MPIPDRVGAPLMTRLLSGWDGCDGPLHRCLVDAVRRVIVSGALPQGAILPSQRALAQALAVSRTTVAVAYDELCTEGWLATRQGGTTWVRQPIPARQMAWRGDRLGSYAADQNPLDLTSGALLASPILQRVLSDPWVDDLRSLLALDGFLPAGLEALRKAVTDSFDDVGLATPSAQLVITDGAHQGLTLVSECLVSAGDTVLVENPTYRGALDVFSRLGAHVVGIRTDNDGIDPSDLTTAIHRHRPRLLYVMPTAHNATGVTWTQDRRRDVASIATRASLLVIEDASTADLQLGQSAGPMGLLLPDEQSVLIGSATKLFWAGLRVGWLRGPEQIVDAVLRARMTTNLAGSLPSQVLAARCLEHRHEARSIRRVELRQAQAETVDLLAHYLPQWRPHPADGSSLWVDTGEDATNLSARLRRRGVILNPGPTFSPSEEFASYVRLPLGHRARLAMALPLIAQAVSTPEAGHS
ncbi:MAG: PLP-dependent aminotransferase family protein [Propionibacteriaceae bacterium]|nr:PLP-dependent aminotransferase family protein [Propionibacteriaceae bacterium]